MCARILALLMIAWLACGLVWGQRPFQKPDKWEFSFFGGWGTLSGRNSFVTGNPAGGTNEVRIESDGGLVVGASVTENLRQHFAAEFNYTYLDQDFDFLNLSPDLARFKLDQAIHQVSYNGLFYLRNRQSRFRPFGLLGAGATYYQLKGDTDARGVALGLDLRNRWQFAFNFGGGVKFLSRNGWGVRFDFRDTLTGVPDYGIPRTGTSNGVVGPAFRPSGTFHHLQFTTGVVYTFKPG